MRLLLLKLFFCALLSSTLSYGQNLRGEPFAFYGEEQSLANVLTAIATHARLGVRIHEDIDADFSGHLKQRTAEDALNYLAASYDLVWYNDGSTLYVDPINALETKLFHLNHLAARQVKRTMQSLSIWDARFEWRALPDEAILMVSGPPRYLELTDETIALLKQQRETTDQDNLSVKIFALTHASATDRRVTLRGEDITLPGVATLLQGLLTGGGATEGGGSELTTFNDGFQNGRTLEDDRVSRENRASLNNGTSVNNSSYRSRSFNSDAFQREAFSSENTFNSKNTLSSENTFRSENAIRHGRSVSQLQRREVGAQRARGVNGAPHPQAAIYADPGSNSVIVQDYASRLALYADLIAQLDQAKPQLEISLLIIDLTANSLRDLGVDWTVATRQTGRGLLDLVLPGASAVAAETLGQTNADFLATVSALESQGKARVTSRPAVVTENGMEALLDNNETFFVRVQGERVASLEQITFGTLLQVVPRIVESTKNADSPLVSLDVTIEDASRLADGGVDALPSIRNTQISTRSSVPNGGSLLIGGYYREATTSNRNGVPILGKLPVLGNLFSHTGDNNSQLVRLFMLSPRILSDSVFTQSENYSENSTLTHSQQIRQLADLSNYNPEINRLRYNGVCESALSARQRRNQYRKDNIATRIMPCDNTDNDKSNETYRVVPL
ncbi:type III secretion system outer membrane ring subunit SctC [Marinibactrum halimedae]|uniref:Type 3 secretion system secretin n=1 Tax=Marinibactrum halimedae TaxID=1444977 RepID=A0AA37T460_9GAMM|nr:type III secretion system outer membrane ring subunit SctC [Marinibactrum halimedae]MCD9459087.1 type III secretion system outer membrane ring subunit SctC [Marinibactrum halimedae]GLS24688.1 hypothetical protein GCM10007877_04020 [Marinibactrum halimedae]